MHGQWSNPVYAVANGQPQVIFPGGDGWLRSFDPATGKVIWRFDCNPKDSTYALGGKGHATTSSPRRWSTTTRSTSASARIPSTTKASAISGASTSPKKATSPRKMTTSTPRPSQQELGSGLALRRTIAAAGKRAAITCSAAPSAPLPFTTAWSTSPSWRAISTALTPRPASNYWTHNIRAPIWSSPYWVDGKVFLGSDDARGAYLRPRQEEETARH